MTIFAWSILACFASSTIELRSVANVRPGNIIHRHRQADELIEDALHRLAKKYNLCILIEGDVIEHLGLSETSSVGDNKSLESQINSLAQTLDCSVERAGNNFLFRKKFSPDRKSIPEVTIQEALACLNNIRYYLSGLELPNYRKEGVSGRFRSLFTREQVQQMCQGDNVPPVEENTTSSSLPRGVRRRRRANLPYTGGGLPVTLLTTEQQRLLASLIAETQIATSMDKIGFAFKQLTRIQKESPFFCNHEFKNIKFFGYAFGLSKQTSVSKGFIPLSHPFNVANGITAAGELAFLVQTEELSPSDPSATNGITEISVVDPTRPDQDDIRSNNFKYAKSLTVEQIFGICDPHQEVTLDDQVKEKTFTIISHKDDFKELFGAESLARLMARFYGLQTVKETSGRMELRTKKLPRSFTYSAIPRMLELSLPLTVQRALYSSSDAGNGSASESSAEPSSLIPLRRPAQTARPTVSLDGHRIAALLSAEDILAVRRLRALLEPKMEVAENHRVALDPLSNREKNLLALHLLNFGTHDYFHLLTEGDFSLHHINELYLIGIPSAKGEESAPQIYLTRVRPDRTLVWGISL